MTSSPPFAQLFTVSIVGLDRFKKMVAAHMRVKP